MAGVGVKDHLPFDSKVLHDPRGHVLRQVVGPLHAPELRHDQVRLDMLEPTGANSAQMVDADDPAPQIPLERVEDLIQQEAP